MNRLILTDEDELMTFAKAADAECEELMTRVLDILENYNNPVMHDCDICGKTPLALGHAHCGICESPLMLVPCKGCGYSFCKTGCVQSHVCGNDPIRY